MLFSDPRSEYAKIVSTKVPKVPTSRSLKTGRDEDTSWRNQHADQSLGASMNYVGRRGGRGISQMPMLLHKLM